MTQQKNRRSKRVSLSVGDLIMPYFVIEGRRRKQAIQSMPGIFRFSVDRLLEDVYEARSLGIGRVLLFGVASQERKNARGSWAYDEKSPAAQAAAALRREFADLAVITDICLCAYTSHGHCGVLDSRGGIASAPTLDALSAMALVHARAGADWVAPSAMAKRQVAQIRKTLDANGFRRTRILGYSAKFASQFYGPFRDAADSAPRFGDRRAYQLDPADAKAALREIADDIREGADMVMVKPALAYLDIVREAARAVSTPLAAFNVSGEYALVKLGARHGMWKEAEAVDEILCSIRRAGADRIISYHAKDAAARWKREGGAG